MDPTLVQVPSVPRAGSLLHSSSKDIAGKYIQLSQGNPCSTHWFLASANTLLMFPPPCKVCEELDVRSSIQDAPPRARDSSAGHASCPICLPTSAEGWLDIGASVSPSQGGKSSTEGLHLPSACLAQQCDAYQSQLHHVSEGSVLTHSAYASFFK